MARLLRTLASVVALLALVQPHTLAQHLGGVATPPLPNDPPSESSLAQQSPLRLLWKRAPLAIGLPVGKERMLTFPTQVRLGLPPGVAARMRVQVVDRTAYLYATAPFAQTRLVAENPLTGAVYLLDVSAKTLFSNAAPVEILEERKVEGDELTKQSDMQEASEALDLVALTRHAAQQVYAPRRLLHAVPDVRPIALDRTPRNDFYRLASIHAEPIGSWKAAAGYVTAVKLTNQSSAAIELDPRALRGRWLAATFQHGRILARGHEEDTTVVYVISERRFDESF